MLVCSYIIAGQSRTYLRRCLLFPLRYKRPSIFSSILHRNSSAHRTNPSQRNLAWLTSPATSSSLKLSSTKLLPSGSRRPQSESVLGWGSLPVHLQQRARDTHGRGILRTCRVRTTLPNFPWLLIIDYSLHTARPAIKNNGGYSRQERHIYSPCTHDGKRGPNHLAHSLRAGGPRLPLLPPRPTGGIWLGRGAPLPLHRF